MIRLFISYCVIFLFALTMSACSDQPEALAKAEQFMEIVPDSALHVLSKMNPDLLPISSDKALYGLLVFQALDKNYKTLQPDTLILFCNSILNDSSIIFCIFCQ